MGKLAIILVSAFTVISALYSVTVQGGRLATDERVAEHQYETLARNAALLAFERGKQQVIDDFSNTASISGTTEAGTYAAALTVTGPDRVAITATGTVASPEGPVEHKVFATVKRELVAGELPEDAPDYLDYSLLVEENLALSGDIDVAVYAQGDEDNQLNSNMHTNGNLLVSGNSSSVQGFGTYVGFAAGNPPSALARTFRPNYNPADAASTQRVERIDIPPFDMGTFSTNATIDETTSGDVTLSGTVDLGGTREDPYIWHINGNLTATGNTRISGYVIFLVENDITFRGNTAVGDTGYDASDESSIAFYAGDDVILAGTSETAGQIYAADDVEFRGTATVYGTVTSRGQAVISGTPNLYYRKASPALSINFEPPPMKMVYTLASYSEK